MWAKTISLLITLAALVGAQDALAAPGAPVTLTNDAHVERPTRVGGEVKMVPVPVSGHLAPGDHITFTFAFRNVSAKPVDHFVVTDAMPQGIVLVADAAPAYEVSVDGGRAWGPIAAATVPDGKGGRRPAEASDVTHVRWVIPVIAPATGGSVSFHALVK